MGTSVQCERARRLQSQRSFFAAASHPSVSDNRSDVNVAPVPHGLDRRALRAKLDRCPRWLVTHPRTPTAHQRLRDDTPVTRAPRQAAPHQPPRSCAQNEGPRPRAGCHEDLSDGQPVTLAGHYGLTAAEHPFIPYAAVLCQGSRSVSRSTRRNVCLERHSSTPLFQSTQKVHKSTRLTEIRPKVTLNLEELDLQRSR